MKESLTLLISFCHIVVKTRARAKICFIIGNNTIINLQFYMPFVAEMEIESSSSGYERL